MPLVKLPSSKLFWVRLAALVFTCVAFSVAAHKGELAFPGLTGLILYYLQVFNKFIFCWAFSFACTLLVLMVEVFGLQSRIPALVWSNFTITVAMYAFFFCLSASSAFGYLLGHSGPRGVDNYHIVSIVFSFLATLAYGVEVRMSRARPKEEKGYMSTNPGQGKVFETFIACLIFFILSYVPYDQHSGLRWCMAVYCICFIVTMAVVVVCVGDWAGLIPMFPKFLFIFELLAAIMYLSATIIWGLQFGNQFEPYLGPASDYYMLFMCALTGGNFLSYLIDLTYSAKQLYSTLQMST